MITRHRRRSQVGGRPAKPSKTRLAGARQLDECGSGIVRRLPSEYPEVRNRCRPPRDCGASSGLIEAVRIGEAAARLQSPRIGI
jgi:hypothetical protein